MTQKINKPTWLNADGLQAAANHEKKAKDITVNLPNNFKTVSSYTCNTCRLQFTSGQIAPQLKMAARAAQSYVACPKCSGFLTKQQTAIVRTPARLADNAMRYTDKNTPIQRGVNSWVDKAIYGRLIQAVADYVGELGIHAPQLRFQRSIRSSKFPNEPHSVKAAEFTVEFTDYNNTRNRIVIQAGLDPKGHFIYPRTFKTLSGNEYPLTARAIEDFTSGKVYDPVMADHSIRPLNYRQSDPTRFREISAQNKKMIKKAFEAVNPAMAQNSIPQNSIPQNSIPQNSIPQNSMVPLDTMDDGQINEYVINVLGIDQNQNPIQYQQLTEALKLQGINGASTNSPDTGGFMNSVGLGTRAFQDIMMDPISGLSSDTVDAKHIIIAEAVERGLTFPEAYDYVLERTQQPLTLEEFDTVGQQIAGEAPMDIEAIASKIMAKAEIQMATKLHKTAEDVQEEYNFDDLTFDEAQNWMDVYLETFNTTVDEGEGTVEAKRKASTAAINALAGFRIKKALRDKNTLVPVVDPDPDYSVAQQTQDSEPKFDMPYDETDGGITPFKDRNISTMFKEKVGEVKTLSLQKQGNLQALYRKLVNNPFDLDTAKLAQEIMVSNTPPDYKFTQLSELDRSTSSQEEIAPIENPFKTGRVKLAEATGTELNTDEVGQNPINYSRYKTMIQDYLRAGNIPPTKVDLHKLKDSGYTLEELKKLVETVQTKDDSAIYPVAHATVDYNKVRKLAEDKLADMYKEMPLEQIDEDVPSELPNEDPEEILEGGIGDNTPSEEFDPVELTEGIKVEMEHITDNEKVAEEIAKDHLTEIPDYYTRLKNMEATAKAERIAKDMPSLVDRLRQVATKKVQEEG